MTKNLSEIKKAVVSCYHFMYSSKTTKLTGGTR